MKTSSFLTLTALAVFVVSITSCWSGDTQARREMLFENQPKESYVENFVGTIRFMSPIALDPMTVQAMDAGGQIIYVRCSDKAKLTTILNRALDGKIHGYEVWGHVRATSYKTKYIGKTVYVWDVTVDEIWTAEDKSYHMNADSVKGYNMQEIEKNSREKSKVRTILVPLPSRTTVTKPCESSAEFDVTLSDGTKIHFQSQGSQSGLQNAPKTELIPKSDSIPRPGATVPVPQ
jgi:hypothetical protein